MRKGLITSRAITEMYLDRIEAIDRNGPMLRSIIEINPDALTQASARDEERKNGKVRGPLHGIPVVVKDNINTADQMMTTAGSLAMEGYHAHKDAFIISKLREAGAVLLGKTNLSEWANFRSSRSSSGWSSRGGQTKNPYSLDRSPCGSSSGSGVAVSANLCVAAIGTETNGSIACPSAQNGIVGLKPTVGLVSRSGIIPISHTQDTAGPMTRTVRDAAIVLGVIAGHDETDRASVSRPSPDYTSFLDPEGLKGKRIGIEKSFLNVHERVDSLFQEARQAMELKGVTIIEVDLVSQIQNLWSSEISVLQFEFKEGLNRYLDSAQAPVKSLSEVIAFNRNHPAKMMPFFEQDILERSEEKGDLTDREYKKALEQVLSTRTIIDDLLKKHQLTAICGPSNGPPWCTDLINGDSFTGYGMYSPAAMAGYPSLVVPMGMVQGLPIGLAFIGTAFSEGSLLSIGYAYEQATRKRMPPEFRNTAV